jgi:hypothetical protein
MNWHELIGHLTILLVAGFGAIYSGNKLVRLVFLKSFKKTNQLT